MHYVLTTVTNIPLLKLVLIATVVPLIKILYFML